MKAIDFLNSSPHYFIFQKESNKTNFGGILFLIFLILMFFISLLYILDYALNEKYEIENYTVDTYEKIDYSQLDKLDFSPEINQEVSFIIKVVFNYYEGFYIDKNELIDNFFLQYGENYYKGYFCPLYECHNNRGDSFIIFNITKNKIFEKDSNHVEMEIKLFYKCNDTNCSNFPYYMIDDFTIITENFEIHHNESIPIITKDCVKSENKGLIEFDHECDYASSGQLSLYQHVQMDLEIATIQYKEKKGISRLFDKLIGNKNEYIITYIENDKTNCYYSDSPYKKKEGDYNSDDNENEVKDNVLYEYKDKYINNYSNFNRNEYNFKFNNDNKDNLNSSDDYLFEMATIYTKPSSKYQLYKRSFISFLDVIANIGALFSTFNFVFIFLYKFYAINFDNFQIIENILENNNKLNKNQISFNKSKIKTQTELTQINLENENMISPLIINNKEVEKDSNNDINEEDRKNINNIEENKVLPKDFYLNNAYFSKCRRSKKQDILDICNKIVSKYISIDYILSNLMILENLIKDYKWSEPGLNNLEKNKLISELLKIL